MEVHTKTWQTPNGSVEGVQTKWPGFSLLMVTGKKGFLACPALDIEACQRYNTAAALVASSPENPIGTLDNFPNRTVSKVNENAKKLGITEGMDVIEAFALIA